MAGIRVANTVDYYYVYKLKSTYQMHFKLIWIRSTMDIRGNTSNVSLAFHYLPRDMITRHEKMRRYQGITFNYIPGLRKEYYNYMLFRRIHILPMNELYLYGFTVYIHMIITKWTYLYNDMTGVPCIVRSETPKGKSVRRSQSSAGVRP